MKVHFTMPGGERIDAEFAAGDTLLRIAQGAGLPLEGTCEGQMACSTCHVVIDKAWFDRLPPAAEEEEDMLDLAVGACRTSRLACQIELDAALDGLSAAIPPDSHDLRRF